jgi:aryl-alcohol dehydrogenase-like predicted oxidoreductase
MDYLVDMQREGLIRSISGKNFPTTIMRSLEGCGYHLDSHRRNFHIISPDNNLKDYQLAASDLGTPNVFSSPLAGGLLTNQFDSRSFPPLSNEVGDVRHKLFTKTLKHWATSLKEQREGRGEDPISYPFAWARYQQSLLPTLRHIALKYRVSVASVALRWLLQTKHTGGTVVGFDMVKYADEVNGCTSRIQSLRNTFRFELDEEDLESIDSISGRIDRDDLYEEVNLKNPKLWL